MTCPNCSAELAPGRSFCTRCGTAVLEPESSRPAPEPPPPQPEPEPQWALGTPPANERWWRNPVVLVAAAVTLLGGGGGLTTWRILAAADSAAPSSSIAAHSTPIVSRTTARGSGAPQDAELARAVDDVDQILVRSQAGRVAAAQQHDFAAALRNRRALVAAVDRVDVPPDARDLALAVAMLRSALEASARADAAHLACRCETKLNSDVVADRLKRRFAARFNPFALRYLGHAIDPQQI